jgi:ATP-dependent RNA helicase DeaD
MQEEEKSQGEDQILEPDDALNAVALEDLPDALKQAVGRAGWPQLNLVQAKAIPYIRDGRDMLIQAKTGSGKTGAFLLPIMEQIDLGLDETQALILAPTRELAQQVEAEAALLAGDSGIRSVAVYGGTSYKPQIDAFKAGAHIVVGTPGRILDHLIKRNLYLDDLKFLVFDEADRLMSMGFYPDMVRVREFLPRQPVIGTMFSATFPVHVKRLSTQFLKQPGFLSLSEDQVHVEDTEHIFYIAPAMDKDRGLVRIIETENPSQAIIFCNTKDRVFYVTRVLQRFGYNADQLSSDLSQNVREQVLSRLRDGKLRFLVATDVAGRGIDVPDLSHVVQYEAPEDVESYIHRAGRTGRAGNTGTAIMLVDYSEKRLLTRIAAHYSIEFEERTLPNDEDVQALVAERNIGQLEARLRKRDRLQIERMRRFAPLAEQLSGTEDGRQLLIMLLDDAYHVWMHSPPELPPVGSKSRPKKSIGGGRRDGGNRGGNRGGGRSRGRGGRDGRRR